MFDLYKLGFVRVKENEKKWSKEKVADAIASGAIQQNFCDGKHNPILVADDDLFKFWKRKYHLIFSFRAIGITGWACEYGFLKSHPSSPAMLTPDNADIPSVFSIDSEFHEEQIKPYLKEEPSVY